MDLSIHTSLLFDNNRVLVIGNHKYSDLLHINDPKIARITMIDPYIDSEIQEYEDFYYHGYSRNENEISDLLLKLTFIKTCEPEEILSITKEGEQYDLIYISNFFRLYSTETLLKLFTTLEYCSHSKTIICFEHSGGYLHRNLTEFEERYINDRTNKNMRLGYPYYPEQEFAGFFKHPQYRQRITPNGVKIYYKS